MYWIYYFCSTSEKIKDRLKRYKEITFPRHRNIFAGEIIILINKMRTTKHIIGYVTLSDKMTSNKNDETTYRTQIFDDLTYCRYSAPIKENVIIKGLTYEKIFGKDIINLNLLNSYDKYDSELQTCHTSVGDIILSKIKEMSKDSTTKVKKYKELNEKKIRKYLIPIMIVPCDDIKKELREYYDEDKYKILLRHILKCDECDVTNNNGLVSIDQLRKNIFAYYIMKDIEEVSTLLEIYHELSEYKTKKYILIRICDRLDEYYGCFCLVGKIKNEK